MLSASWALVQGESQGDSSPSSCTAIVHRTRNRRWNPWDTGKTGVTLLGRVTAGGRKQVKAQGPLEGHQCRHLNSSQSMFHLGVIWRKFFIKDLMEVSLDWQDLSQPSSPSPANVKVMPACYRRPFSWGSCPYFLPKRLHFPLGVVSQGPLSRHSLTSVTMFGQNLFECWPWPLKGQVADFQLQCPFWHPCMDTQLMSKWSGRDYWILPTEPCHLQSETCHCIINSWTHNFKYR